MIVASQILIALSLAAGFVDYGRIAHQIGERITAVERADPYLFIGTEIGEVIRYDLRTDRWDNLGAPPSSTGGYILDLSSEERYLYIGAVDGVFRYDRRIDAFDSDYDSSSIRGPTVRRILSDERYRWFAGAEVTDPSDYLTLRSVGGLTRYDDWMMLYSTWTESEGLTGNDLYDLLSDGTYLWVASSSGLTRIGISDDSVRSYGAGNGMNDPRIFSMAADDDYLYLGGAGVVYRFDPEMETAEVMGLTRSADGEVRRILATPDYILLGTEGEGLFVMDKAADRWFRVDESTVPRHVTDLADDGGDGFWLAAAAGPSSSSLLRFTSDIPEGPAGRESYIDFNLERRYSVSTSALLSGEFIDDALSRIRAAEDAFEDWTEDLAGGDWSPSDSLRRDRLDSLRAMGETAISVADRDDLELLALPGRVRILSVSGEPIVTVSGAHADEELGFEAREELIWRIETCDVVSGGGVDVH